MVDARALQAACNARASASAVSLSPSASLTPDVPTRLCDA